MFRRLSALYTRRIINVNVNILLAGLLALIPTLAVVRLVEHMLAKGLGAKLHLGDKLIITISTFVADMVFDVSIYYALHWLANHSHRPKRTERLETIADAAAENVPFFRDATKVQFQRLVMSPLLYLIFLGGQFVLMSVYGVSPVWATFFCFLAALSVIRTLHTLWMRWEERKRAAVLAGKVCEKCGHSLKDLRPDQPCPRCGAARPKTAAPAMPPSDLPPSPPPKPEPGTGAHHRADAPPVAKPPAASPKISPSG